MQGKFILIVGPSGSGKGTLISFAKERFPEIVFPSSYSTRAMRPGETQGNPYHFISRDEFQEKVRNNELLEWAEYSGNCYATGSKEIIETINKGGLVLKELEVQGVRQVLKQLPRENIAIIFIHAGSWEELEHRITERAPISEEELVKRKERYEDEMSFLSEADHVIQNQEGDLEQAKKEFEKIITSLL